MVILNFPVFHMFVAYGTLLFMAVVVAVQIFPLPVVIIDVDLLLNVRSIIERS